MQGGGDRPFKTYESNFIHHDFVQFGRQHSQYKANLASSVISRATNFLTEKLKILTSLFTNFDLFWPTNHRGAQFFDRKT